ncbi:hypothetical protein [Marinobacter salarius]|uniref:hypothetical protein n=1 Tax=Marinobacter salarius TaxID=1420917 RepID=UPI003BACB062
MIDIHLHGLLKDQYKEKYTLAIDTPAEGIRALSCQLPDFEKTIKKGNWKVIVGPLDKDKAVESEERINTRFGNDNQMHIIPAVEGAGNSSTWLGIALIGASFFIPASGLAIGSLTVSATTVGFVGAALATYGVASSMTDMQQGQAGNRESVAERPSFLFDGPANTSSEGLAVPIVIGEILTGSVVVNAGLSVDQIPPQG